MSRRPLSIALAGLLSTVVAIASAGPPAPAGTATSATAASAAPTATASAAPTTAAPTTTAPAVRKGVAVVLVGPADAPRAERARELARFAYRSPNMRPSLDEAAVRVLAGEAPPPDAPPELAALAAARSAIPLDVDGASALAAIEDLARRAGVRAIALVVPGTPEATVRIAHTDGPGATRMDPASVTARPISFDGQDDFSDVASSVERIVGPPPVAAPTPPPSASARPPASAAPAGPRRADAKGSKPHGPPVAPEEEENLLENPWFWVVVGAVATAGVTIIVVTQTTDVNTGTVSVGGKVLQ